MALFRAAGGDQVTQQRVATPSPKCQTKKAMQNRESCCAARGALFSGSDVVGAILARREPHN